MSKSICEKILNFVKKAYKIMNFDFFYITLRPK